MSDQSLKDYYEKRDLSVSDEPEQSSIDKYDEHFFVVQLHDASTLHYDLRLRIGDQLASWAVPKGPSIDPSTKRLAIKTDDHPLAYADFEGVIPAGNYGAGTVLVWDRGAYMPKDNQQLDTMVQQGQIEVVLQGKKLKGGFALVRIDDDKDQRLLIKMKDDHAREDDLELDHLATSVISGATLEEVAQQAADT